MRSGGCGSTAPSYTWTCSCRRALSSSTSPSSRPATLPGRECARSSLRKTRDCCPWERARLGANGTVFASPQVRGLYELLFAEAWPVELNPGRFRSDEARVRVLGRTARILGDLEAAIRRELAADRT